MEQTNRTDTFTLIELLIVVAIIGILAALIIVSVTTAAAKARDARRQQDLRNMQEALAMYYTANGSYPSTNGNWEGNCSGFGSYPTSGTGGYIPGLAPTYIPNLPLDPRQGTPGCLQPNGSSHPGNASACYLYRSDGTDYKLIDYYGVEVDDATATNQYSQFYDPTWPNCCTYSLFTPGSNTSWGSC
ncbi:prepilin-type N-terminal cleavage/methylation domain-containing protein [Patescibacteria group bacterium]|nr:prepilin-type N-terminal cleavage/methylation domain-containing protein [Patescibacteria group bacterium]